VSSQQGETYAQTIEAEFYEVSAKENTGITDLFTRCALKLHQRDAFQPRPGPSNSILERPNKPPVGKQKKEGCKC